MPMSLVSLFHIDLSASNLFYNLQTQQGLPQCFRLFYTAYNFLPLFQRTSGLHSWQSTMWHNRSALDRQFPIFCWLSSSVVSRQFPLCYFSSFFIIASSPARSINSFFICATVLPQTGCLRPGQSCDNGSNTNIRFSISA